MGVALARALYAGGCGWALEKRDAAPVQAISLPVHGHHNVTVGSPNVLTIRLRTREEHFLSQLRWEGQLSPTIALLLVADHATSGNCGRPANGHTTSGNCGWPANDHTASGNCPTRRNASGAMNALGADNSRSFGCVYRKPSRADEPR
jgi:hypothetical protein